MDGSKIIVRAARPEDAATIAHAVALAIGDERALQAYCGEDYQAVLTEIARREATQYSYRQALIAEVDGTAPERLWATTEPDSRSCATERWR